jgi:hypothetical protein
MTRPRDIPDPAALGFRWPKMQKALDEYRRLQRQRTDAMAEQAELRRKRQEAEREDADAHVAAIRAGKGDPGTPREDAVKAEMQAMERRVKALTGATEQAERELLTVIEAEQPAMLAEAAAAVDERRDGVAAAVEAWAEARTRYDEALAVHEYLRDFPNGRYKAGGGHMRNRPQAGPFGPGAPSPTYAETLAILRRDAEPPPEQVTPLNVQPLQPAVREIGVSPVPNMEPARRR